MDSTPNQELKKHLKNEEFRKQYGEEAAKLELASLIYKARKKMNLTQTEMAGRLGISQPYIARIEAGEANPTISSIGRILATLNFSFSAELKPLDDDSVQDKNAVEEQRRHQSLVRAT